MNKLAKVILFAAAFLFVGGCASQKPVAQPVPVKSTVVKAKHHHHGKKCHGKHCVGKLGASADENMAK